MHVHLCANVRAIIGMDACIFVLAVFVHRPARSGVRAPLNRARVWGGALRLLGCPFSGLKQKASFWLYSVQAQVMVTLSKVALRQSFSLNFLGPVT